MKNRQALNYDYIIIGSGFGGSVAACRLSEKGYRVLVLEKGKRLTEKDFPKTNWHLKKWMWLPFLRFFGLFKLTFFRHVTIMSGIGVGGGSLVYGNVLAVPRKPFFTAHTWAHLADWEEELKPFYRTASAILGSTTNPRMEVGDKVLRKLAKDIEREEHFEPVQVSVYFGEPDITVPDPYFGGKGLDRTGCSFCGACMIGCPHNAKNTLDKNYLYFAQQNGAQIQPESEVYDVLPLNGENGKEGYLVKWRSSTSYFKSKGVYTSGGVVFSAGVLGTIGLLLRLKRTSLPKLSDKLGTGVRTNSESLIGVTTFDKNTNFSDGIAIGSIVHIDEHTHFEAVRYPSGSGFWRLLAAPMVSGRNMLARLIKLALDLVTHPVKNLKVIFVADWAKKTQILLFMQTIDTVLRFKRGILGMKTAVDSGVPPSAFVPEAHTLATKYSDIVNGKPQVLVTETLLGIPTTAHILGGAVMGNDIQEGVIDKNNRVFGYENMYVCDGSMISANLGVNPALTITALTERTMSKIPNKDSC